MNKIAVIGQGYVGLPLAKGAVDAGFEVIGLEANPNTAEALNNGISHVDDISNEEISAMLSKGYQATVDPKELAGAAVVIVCVPTPLGDAGSPDLSMVISAFKTLSANISSGTTVVLESTTYPGTTEDLCLPILTATGKKLDEDFFLAFSPERIDPGNQTYRLENTPKVVGGVTSASTAKAAEFYSKIVEQVVTAKGAKEAETSKLLENTYRHVNIALVNEMSKFCNDLNIDLWDVINAAKTKPFGFQAFYPGPGVGGHCIPIDPNYLSYEVRKSLGYPFRFVELAQEINNSMPDYVISRIQEILNNNCKSVKGSKVLILGVTYKPDIADQRESPATPIGDKLVGLGADVSFHDPKVPAWKLLSGGLSLNVVEDLEAAVVAADIVVCLQNHHSYDLDRLATISNEFFDTRGAVNPELGSRL